MKKTRYVYTHNFHGTPNSANANEVRNFFESCRIKLHIDYNKKYFYTWEDAGYECSWFTFSHVEEVEISQTVTKLDSENKYTNGMNWKNVGNPYANSRLRKVNTNNKGHNVKKSTKLPINPRTGLRDGGV